MSDDETPGPIATPEELGTYLGVTADTERAALLLDLATGIARGYADPLPPGAKGVVLASVARAYANPQQVASESLGPYSASSPFPGLYFTRQERSTLRSLAGRGGAFTIDPTPVGAGTGLPPWDRNIPGGVVDDEYRFDESWP